MNHSINIKEAYNTSYGCLVSLTSGTSSKVAPIAFANLKSIETAISSSKSPTGLPIVPVVLTHALLDDATNLAERLSVLDSN